MLKESVESGRDYVEASVAFIHYVERLYVGAQGVAGHHGEAGEAGKKCPHLRE